MSSKVRTFVEDGQLARKTLIAKFPERVVIEGRSATIAYLTNEFVPVGKDEAELVKIIFDDGELIFAVPVGSSPLAHLTPSAFGEKDISHGKNNDD